MIKINYESDFKLTETTEQQRFADVPFEFVYTTSSGTYTASYDGHKYVNCKPNSDHSVTVIFNNHGLGVGKLKVRREFFIPDRDFPDGVYNVVSNDTTDVILVEGKTEGFDVEETFRPPYVVSEGSLVPIEVVDSLDSDASDKALSARQGKVLKGMIPAKVSELENDEGYITDIPDNIATTEDVGEAVNELQQKVDEKAPKVGYAPDLKVNFANELTGRGEATDEEIGIIRPTGVRSIGDGNATIERVKGKSVVWNQLEPNYDLSNNALSSACKNTTTVNGIVSIEGVTSYTAYIYASQDKIKIYQGHKYLLSVEVICAEYVPTQMVVYDLTNRKSLIAGVRIWQGSNKWNKISNITTATTNGIGSFLIYPAYNSAISDTLTDWQGRNFIVHDLTLMFGAGNEPNTIEEFEARKPLGVTNEYNEGEIISYDGDAIKSVGFNAYNGTYAKVIGGEEYHATGTTSVSFAKELGGATIAITSDSDNKFIPEEDGYVYAEGTDIVIHLTHSYTPDHVDEYEEDTHLLPDVKSILDADGNPLFPYGLLSAGSVHDEITATKAVKRVGRYVIDGSQSWDPYNNSFRLISPTIDCAKSKYTLLSSRYNALKTMPGGGWATFPDKSILLYNVDVKMFVAYDSSYSTAKDFQASLVSSPIIVNYELAEPIEVDLPEPLNMTYEAWDFGTEELVADTPTTPLNADIVYQFNAVDRIRENSSAIDALEEHVDEHKNDGIELLGNGNLKLTLKGETKEFMPATPSGDPMHYAYVGIGAEYNATTNYTLKSSPWKNMVDTIEDKAKWGLDVVDASRVKQMYIGSTVYNYATENRTSPEGGTYLRYFLVGQGSNGVWVEDETRVLCLPGCWYFNGLGDITNVEMRKIRFTDRTFVTINRGLQNTKARTLIFDGRAEIQLGQISLYSDYLESFSGFESSGFGIPAYFNVFLASATRYCFQLKWNSNIRIYCTPVTEDSQVRVFYINGITSVLKVLAKYLSKPSVKYIIEKAAPTSAITITLHPDAYARLADDADIVAALEAQPLVTLVSA